MPIYSKTEFYAFNGLEIPEDAFKELQIDIDCDDEATIKSQIEKMRKDWSQATAQGKNIYRLKIDPAYIPILLDASNRNEYRLVVKTRRKREYEERVKQAHFQVEAWLKDPQASEDRKQRIIRMCSDALGPTPEEMGQWFLAARTRTAPTLPAMDAIQQLLFDLEVEPLPSAKAGPIADLCKKMGKANLYDYLGMELSQADEIAKITSAKKAREDERNRLSNMGLDGAYKPIHGSLIAFVEELLVKDPAKRRQYLRTIGEERLAPMMTTLDLKFRAEKDKKLSVAEKTLGADFIEVLLRSVEGVVPKPVAMHIILQRAGKEGYNAQVPTVSIDEVVCPSCQMPNSKGARVCSCGYHFVLVCPKCSNTFPTRAGQCDRCGFDLSDIERFAALLRETARLIKDNALSDAQTLINKARVDVGAGNADLNELEKQVAGGRQGVEAALEDARRAFQSHKLFEARSRLESLLRSDRSNAEGKRLFQFVSGELLTVDRRLAAARLAESAGRVEEAACGYAEVLDVCSDCKDAAEAIHRLPPSPPADLSVAVEHRRVSLRWSPSPSRGMVEYQIVRKVGGAPGGSRDGDEVAKTGGNSLDDLNAPVGSVVFYAVYALRGGVLSRAAAASASVLVTADVEELTAISAKDSITVAWNLPGAVHDVVVVRRTDKAPKSPEDGTTVSLSSRSNAVDRDVRNNQVYFYGVFCRFRTSDGSLSTSNGAFVSATPEPPPPPLLSFRTYVDGSSVKVSWDKGAWRQVCVVRTEQPYSLPPGSTIPKHQIDSVGVILKPLGESEAVDVTPRQSLAYYTIFSLSERTAVVGATRKFANIADASGTRLEKTAGVLQAYWKWPPNANIAKVAWRSDTFPSHADDPKATSARITIADFNGSGRFVLPMSGDADCYLTVCVGIAGADDDIYAGGQSEGARAFNPGSSQITVSYAVKKGFLGSNRQLQFSATAPCELPGAVIVGKSGSLPMSILDGTPLVHLPGMSIAAKTGAQVAMPSSPKGHYVKVFLNNAQDYARFLMMHPPKDDLKI